MKIDLSGLSLKELKALQADISKAIAEYDTRKKREALAELEAKARELGFGLNELLGGAPAKKSRAPASVKYIHPENPSLTWTGRGRKPKWFDAALSSGKTLEDLTA